MTNIEVDNNKFVVCLLKFFFFSFHGNFDGIDFLSVDCVIDLKIPPLEIDGNDFA
jgi:hypothetical protein